MVRGSITSQRRVTARLVAAAGALIAALAFAPAAAHAAPKAATPTAVQITGKGITTPITIQQTDDSRLFSSLLDEVTWLATTKSQISAPPANKLGAKFTVVVMIKNVATQTYDLYPAASGGPRVHRPAKQPNKKTVSDGWFYGRLTMPTTLQAAGAPINAKPDVVSGGLGGGVGTDISTADPDPVAGVNSFLNGIRHLVLLNGAVLIVILVGLAGIAFMIRRRV